MFHFAFSRLARRSAAKGAAPAEGTALVVPGLDYYDAQTEPPQVVPVTALSPERAALEQAFGYWSET